MQLINFRRPLTPRARDQHHEEFGVSSCVVDAAISEALAWIASDPGELYLYKYPRECDYEGDRVARCKRIAARVASRSNIQTPTTIINNQMPKTNVVSVGAISSLNNKVRQVKWLRIQDFSIEGITQQLYEYLNSWQLSPSINFIVRLEKDKPRVHPQGTTYHLAAYFTRSSKGNSSGSTPPMTKVDFRVHMSRLLPNYYPVMLTYRFENSNCIYYALGKRRVQSLDFQRCFIDMALEMKSPFYVEPLRNFTQPQKLCLDSSEVNNDIGTSKQDQDRNDNASNSSGIDKSTNNNDIKESKNDSETP